MPNSIQNSNKEQETNLELDSNSTELSKEQANNDKRQLFSIVRTIAVALKIPILVILVLGLLASAFLIWKWVSFTSGIYWTVVKLLPFLIPLAIWGFLYWVLAELAELPQMVDTAKKDSATAIQYVKNRNQEKPIEPPKTFWQKCKRLFKILSSANNFASIAEVVTGVILIANPLFLLLAGVSAVIFFLEVVIAILILIF